MARQKAILKNFVDCEDVYVDALSVAIQYSKALTANITSSQPVISQDEITCIFFQIPELYRHHSEFLQLLRMAESNEWNMTQVRYRSVMLIKKTRLIQSNGIMIKKGV